MPTVCLLTDYKKFVHVWGDLYGKYVVKGGPEAGADPGFPVGGMGQPTIFPKISKKVYKNAKILGRRGARAGDAPTLDPLLRRVFVSLYRRTLYEGPLNRQTDRYDVVDGR